MSERQNFVLVHGAFHGGWCSRRVVDHLCDAGGRVLAPTLTGFADRSHLATASINLTMHIDDVINPILWEDLSDVCCAGIRRQGWSSAASQSGFPSGFAR